MPDSLLTKNNKIGYYLARMESRGFNPELVLEGTDLHQEQVGRDQFSPTPSQYRCIIRNIISLTGEPHIGFALGDEFKVSNLGVLGYAALSAADLAHSRSLFTKYDALVEHIVLPSTEVSDQRWCTELKEIFPLGELTRFAVEEFVSRTCGLAASLTNRPFPVLELRVTYPQPENMEEYEKRFDCPVYFDQPRNLILWDIRSQEQKISLANEEVCKLCEQQCKMLIDQMADADLLSSKIRNALVKSPGEFPTLEEMSKRLNMGSRTLRRRLVQESLTYQQILDETRKDLAIQYLEYTSLTPKEIGFLLGYTSVSNFRRAFKGWTGKKLTDYRANG
ncbi:MAG: AraC family transcriptional regulator [Halieaceae bacterium]|jgi:AraC-like DNA-binding protein|nr:AraC family transcriptional regulator [Halieaceae bacterium]